MKNKNIFLNIYLIIYILVFLFGRSFNGIQIFDFRLGEIFVGIAMISLPFFIITNRKKITDNYIYLITLLIGLHFILTILLTNGTLLSSYTVRSSSYIWTIGFFFIANYFFSKMDFDNIFFLIVPFLMFLVYILSTLYFPKTILNFFIEYSDKFEFLKGSDMLLIWLISLIFSKMSFKNNSTYIYFLIFSSSLFLPIFLYKSKGAFYPAIIFLLFEIFINRKILLKNKFKFLFFSILCIPIFIFSIYNSWGNLSFQRNSEQYEAERDLGLSESITYNIKVITNEKNTSTFASFFISDGRLYSKELMLNWRLQIWQDIYLDMLNQNILFTGYGYNEKIPAMDDKERWGSDGSNENVHNYFVNIFARGGLIQLLLFIVFHMYFIIYFYKRNDSYKILLLIVPALLTSTFDASMESVRFPLLYYSSLAYIFNEKRIYKL